jgi:tRNA U38,U39,U40 pseudouridine synthase TruA
LGRNGRAGDDGLFGCDHVVRLMQAHGQNLVGHANLASFYSSDNSLQIWPFQHLAQAPFADNGKVLAATTVAPVWSRRQIGRIVTACTGLKSGREWS